MATATATISPSALILNGDIDVGGGTVGDFASVTTSANFSIVPDIAPQNFPRYYSTYFVTTNSAISITMPAIAAVSEGWRCKFDLTSSNGNGSITVLDSSAAQVGLIPATSSVGGTVGYGSIELTAFAGGWIAVNFLPKQGPPSYTLITGANGYPMYSKIAIGTFAAICDTGAGAVIDVNTTTDVALRWANPAFKYVDTNFFNPSPSSNTQVQVVLGSTYIVTAIIGIANAASATQANIRIRPRINGVTYPSGFSTITGTVQPFTDGVYYLTAAITLAANDYFEIMVGKTVTSVGTNPVDLAHTTITVELASTY